MDSKRNQAEIVPEEEDEEEEDEDADYITLAKKLENCQLYSKAVDTEDLMISSLYVEYELKLANGDVNEVWVDSKEQEIELSQLNDLDPSDEPSEDKENTFIIPEEVSSISQVEGEGDIYKINTLEDFKIEANVILEENSEKSSSENQNKSYLWENQACEYIQTDIINSEMNLVFDNGNNPIIVDHATLDESLERINRQLYQELNSYKEFLNLEEGDGSIDEIGSTKDILGGNGRNKSTFDNRLPDGEKIIKEEDEVVSEKSKIGNKIIKGDFEENKIDENITKGREKERRISVSEIDEWMKN